MYAIRWKCRTQKISICVPSHNAVRLYLRNVSTIGKQLFKQQYVLQMSPQSVPASLNDFHVLAALLHGSQVVGVSQTLQH